VKLVLVVAIFSVMGSAADKHLPLSNTILTAKNVYIDNRSGSPRDGDRAYQEICAWGRFQVIQDKSQADLVFVITAYSATEGNIWSPPSVNAFSVLTVLDAKTGQTLWTDSKYAGRRTMKKAINNLRERIEEQIPPPPKKR
jgi:hypothetical protein